jgi:hypothetical protein
VPSPFADVLAALARTTADLGLRWYVFGAQAAILYGAERLTNDIDVTIDAAGVGTRDLIAALRRRGFDTRVKNVAAFAAETHVLPMRHRRHGIDVDVVLAGPGPEQTFLERAVRRKLEHVWVPLASAEDVIVMKILSARPKDIDDVKAMLVAQQRRLDRSHVRTMLKDLDAALDRNDLLAAFDALVIRRRPKRAKPGRSRSSRSG